MNIKLPDGSIKEVAEDATVADVAAAIGTGLAKAALGGKIEGKFADLTTPVTVSGRTDRVRAADRGWLLL